MKVHAILKRVSLETRVANCLFRYAMRALKLAEKGVRQRTVFDTSGDVSGWRGIVSINPDFTRGGAPSVQVVLYDNDAPLEMVHRKLEAEGYVFNEPPIGKGVSMNAMYILNVYLPKA